MTRAEPRLPALRGTRVPLPPTPRPPEGVVSWNMNTQCNYRCTYCTQRFLDDRTRWARDVPRFLTAFSQLEGPWEVKLSGGEPFLHPQFLDVVRGLAEHRRAISVVTNFSSSLDVLRAFVDAAGAQLRVLSCSLHVEYVDIDDGTAGTTTVAAFLAKCVTVQSMLPAGASLVVTCVATRALLPRLPSLLARLSASGVRFKVQPEKRDRDVIDYTSGERDQLVQLGGHNGLGVVAPDFGGQPCWAGARSFIVDDRGLAFRCYPARRYRRETLGNFLDASFTLRDAPTTCLYSYCNCTVPIARRMMPRDPNSGAIDVDSATMGEELP
jgi:hypothetical protein